MSSSPPAAVTPSPRLLLARAAAAAAAGVAGVQRLDGGRLGEVVTIGGRDHVRGVRVLRDPHRVEVHVVADLSRPLVQLADDVRAAVGAAIVGAAAGPPVSRVDVHIADVATPGGKGRRGRSDHPGELSGRVP